MRLSTEGGHAIAAMLNLAMPRERGSAPSESESSGRGDDSCAWDLVEIWDEIADAVTAVVDRWTLEDLPVGATLEGQGRP
jgi:DNA-binding IscR family transcriptional regulator